MAALDVNGCLRRHYLTSRAGHGVLPSGRRRLKMAEDVNQSKENQVRKLTDETMSNLAEICENDETGYSQQMMVKAGEVQDAIYDAMNEATVKVDDLVAEIYALAFRHAIQDLWDHGYVVDTEESPVVTEDECRARCRDAESRGMERAITLIAMKLAAKVNRAIKDERSCRETCDYFEATVASAQKEALEDILFQLPNMTGAGNLRVGKMWDDADGIEEVQVTTNIKFSA